MTADRPVVHRGLGLGWPVFAALQEPALRQREDRPVEVEDAEGRTVTARLSEVLDELSAPDPRGLYLRHQLVSEFDPGLWALVPRGVRRHNWLSALPEDVRPDWAWVMIGAAGTRSPMHVDVAASAAWNLLCAGRKRWAFHPRRRAEEWHLLPAGCAGDDRGAEPVELVQEPGDVVVTPSGWAHEVVNLTGTVSITANFVNGGNLDFALRYFDLVGDEASRDLLTAVGASFGHR
ncbi:transcription factor jumonji [Saccharothrix syringae]|uniref:Transcription factor jumonji n=1 Tax=Saccharothrix syringae TaxID=103733 RepID=A0A5Q0HCH9_SACSY|nr:transcription factor jumonji [Saccharothrix syringae]